MGRSLWWSYVYGDPLFGFAQEEGILGIQYFQC